MPLALSMTNVSFRYTAPAGEPAGPDVLRGAALAVPQGAFAVLVGATGSGKTTLLRLAKPEVAPAGVRAGRVEVAGHPVEELARNPQLSASLVGYVFQDPASQVVCDTVQQEMAFGLENLGVPQGEMRRRVAETCYFLGIEPWFHARTADLSGGQRQVVALASALVMRPRLLLLDEPTSMLDPVAARGFLSLLRQVNQELGVTVVVATHDAGLVRPFATCAFEVADGVVREVGLASPAGRDGLLEGVPRRAVPVGQGGFVRLREAWYRYGRQSPWVLRGLDLDVAAGEVRAVVGGNGSGKSTLLSLVAGVARPQRGRAESSGRSSQALLPQDPKALLSCQSVGEELAEWQVNVGYADADVTRMLRVVGLVGEEGGDADRAALLARHPYDLSGGQQQELALAKLLLTKPRLLLLDEPTKGLDAPVRLAVARAVAAARDAGTTIILSTHDLAFARTVADTVTLLFDGQASVIEPAGDFFAQSWLWRG